MTTTRMLSMLLLVATLFAGCVSEEESMPGDDEYEETVYVEDGWQDQEGKADGVSRISPVCTPSSRLSLSACALLGTIAYAEGTGAHYNYTYAYRKFTSYRDHPRIRVCAGGWCSTAAGRYQILSKTWNGIRSGLSDFSPANQDAAALRLIRNRGVTNVDGIDTLAEFQSAMNKLNREWASLPGSPYGQPTYSTAQLWTQFKRLRGI